jgi:hypothetical protein
MEPAYVTLFNMPTASIHEIAKILSLSEQQVHDALDKLASLSLAHWKHRSRRSSRMPARSLAVDWTDLESFFRPTTGGAAAPGAAGSGPTVADPAGRAPGLVHREFRAERPGQMSAGVCTPGP